LEKGEVAKIMVFGKIARSINKSMTTRAQDFVGSQQCSTSNSNRHH
jgi:hypothetical protein